MKSKKGLKFLMIKSVLELQMELKEYILPGQCLLSEQSHGQFYGQWPPTFAAVLDLKVGGHFEFTKSAITLSRKKISPLTLF